MTVWSKTEVCPILHSEGMSAISRGLSVRDTPGGGAGIGLCILKGCGQVPRVSQKGQCWHPFRMPMTWLELFCAQPPANR